PARRLAQIRPRWTSHRSARHVLWQACNDPASAKRFHRYVHFRVTRRAAPGHTVARRTSPETGAAPLSAVPEVTTGEEMVVKRIRIDRPGIRRERPWLEVLPTDPRDPDVVRAKVLARAQQAGADRRFARAS